MAGKKVNPVQLGPGNTHIISGVAAPILAPWAWGENSWGDVGDNTTIKRSSPVSVVGNHSFTSLELGKSQGIGIKQDGTVWAWGRNNIGQLGDNTNDHTSSPVSVVGNHSFIEMSGGRYITAGRKVDGALWTWGTNYYGELGNNSDLDPRSSPISVVGNHSFIQVSSGRNRIVALKANGTAWSFGYYYGGALGDNTTENRSSPVSVVGDHSFISVSSNGPAGGLKADGTLWCWGYNNGSIGDNNSGSGYNRSSPTSVVGNHSFIQVSMAYYQGVARKADGTVWTWGGTNSAGQLGDGTTTGRSSPVSVVGNHSFIKVAGGWARVRCLKEDGSAWAWGQNNAGGLGDNTIANKSSPVSVVGAHSFTTISSYFSGLAGKTVGSISSIAQELNNTEIYNFITNKGSTHKLIISLPNAAAGITYDFYCAETVGIRIVTQAGHTIRIGGYESAPGGYAESTTVGSFLTLKAINSTNWVACAKTGAWTVPFQFKVKTDNPGSASNTFILPLYNMSGYDFNIDWGDLTNDDITVWNDAALTHVYAGGAGTYTVTITGTCPRIYFNQSATDRRKITEILNWGNIGLTSCSRMFFGCSNLIASATDAPDLSAVTDMSYMFADASSWNGDMNSWDVSTITDMSYLFNGCTVFNKPLNSWDVSSVTNMIQMFYAASAFNQDIGDWVPSSVLNMTLMFAQASIFNQDLDAWDVSSVTNMSYMFQNAYAFNGALNGWDVSSVTNMSYMFSGAQVFNKPLNLWDVSSVANMSSMFSGASAFNQDISGWVTTSLDTMNQMFAYASAFNQDISGWDISLVTALNQVFLNATSFNQDISAWITSSITNLSSMFEGATSFNQAVSTWVTSSVTAMGAAFSGATAFDQDLGSWDITALTDATDMFNGVTLSTSNYDSLLNGWAAQSVNSNVTFSGGSSTYSSESSFSHYLLENVFSWTITDGGSV